MDRVISNAERNAKMKSHLKIGDKVAAQGTILGRIVERGFTGGTKSFDFGVNISSVGIPFIAGFNDDELTKVEET